jgi:excisionase family DNA binding protein
MEAGKTGTEREQFYTISEAAQLLKVSDQSIRRWIKAGELKAYRPKKEYRIAQSDLQEFLEGRAVPLVQSPLPESPEERRSDWEVAVRNAHQLQEHGRTRMEGLLSAWRESKERGENPTKRRTYLDEMGRLLQQAYDARPTLFEATSWEALADQWPEVQKADEFYRELWRLVEAAKLHIRTGNAQQERPKAVEEREAA